MKGQAASFKRQVEAAAIQASPSGLALVARSLELFA